jgi:L-2-hydroxyglutarate oxidase
VNGVSDKKTDVLIIGGGLVGLSTAMYLQALRPRLAITLIEKDEQLAAQQSGHNSGVIHAGIYYEPGTLKARFCVQGHLALLKFCAKRGIPVIKCGKVIVANTDEEIGHLERLYSRGTNNRVPGLRMLEEHELRQIEPNVAGERALYAPHSAVVDYKRVAAVYARIFQDGGGTIKLDTELLGARETKGLNRVETTAGDFEARLIINCAGLHADIVAMKTGTKPGIRIIPFRGEYFELRRESRHLVNRLVYPVPDPRLPFLDVHLTPTVNGTVEAGPNAVLATKREGYSRQDFDFSELVSTLSYGGFWWLVGRYWKPGLAEINRSLRKSVFVRSLQRLVPAITEQDLVPGGAGVRAQAVDRRGRLIDDFQIEESPGAIHVLNAPSPAATSSLMIGKFIADKADLRINVD